MGRLIAVLFLMLMSCETTDKKLFNFIFGVEDISISALCEDNPPIFEEGRYIGVYSINREDLNRIVSNIESPSPSQMYEEIYHVYESPIWDQTPIDKDNPILKFVHSQLSDELNRCFDERDIRRILLSEGNKYLELKDNLGRTRLFVFDTKAAKLFLLTSYIL